MSSVVLIPQLLAGIVTERVKEAHQDRSAPIMMLFPGNQFSVLHIIIHMIYAVFQKLKNYLFDRILRNLKLLINCTAFARNSYYDIA